MEAQYRKIKTIQNKKGHPLVLRSYLAPNFLLQLTTATDALDLPHVWNGATMSQEWGYH